MGHPEVAQPPCQRGNDAQAPEGSRTAGGDIIPLGHGKIPRQRLCVGYHRIHAACHADAEHHHNKQRNGHKNGLDEVGKGNRHKAAQHRVADDHNSSHDHRRMIVHPEQAVEKRPDGLKAGGGIGDEEHQNNDRCNGGKQVLSIPEPPGEIVRYGDGAQPCGIAAQPPCHDEPVEIGAHRQTDAGPCDLRQAAQVGKARKPHQQIAAHVAGFGAHGRYQGAHFTAAQIKIIAAFAAALSAEIHPHQHHRQQINRYRQNDHYLRTCHFSSLLYVQYARSIAHKLVDENTERCTDFILYTAANIIRFSFVSSLFCIDELPCKQ